MTKNYLTPELLNDTRLGVPNSVPAYTHSPEWVKLATRITSGTRYKAGQKGPVTRHNFEPRKSYLRPWLLPNPREMGLSSAVCAVTTALGMGKDNHNLAMQAAGPGRCALKIQWQVAKNTGETRNHKPASLTDAIVAAADCGLISDVYKVGDYDQLIAAVSMVGPVVMTIPWYTQVVRDKELSKPYEIRIGKPWGDFLGYTSLVVGAFSANGLLCRLDHFEDWQKDHITILEEDLVELLADSGEVLAFHRAGRTPKNRDKQERFYKMEHSKSVSASGRVKV